MKRKDKFMEVLAKGTLQHLGERQEDSEAAPQDSDNTFDSRRKSSGASESENPNLSQSQEVNQRQKANYQSQLNESLSKQGAQRTNQLLTVQKELSSEKQQSQSVLRNHLLQSQKLQSNSQNNIQLISTGLNILQTGLSENEFTLNTVGSGERPRKSPLIQKKPENETKTKHEIENQKSQANTQRGLLLTQQLKEAVVTLGQSRMQELKVNHSEASFEIHTSQVTSQNGEEDEDDYGSEDDQ